MTCQTLIDRVSYGTRPLQRGGTDRSSASPMTAYRTHSLQRGGTDLLLRVAYDNVRPTRYRAVVLTCCFASPMTTYKTHRCCAVVLILSSAAPMTTYTTQPLPSRWYLNSPHSERHDSTNESRTERVRMTASPTLDYIRHGGLVLFCFRYGL
jgi:hypothetical protein